MTMRSPRFSSSFHNRMYNKYRRVGKNGVRILLAEDDMNLNRVIARRLRLEGYEVDAHPNGAAAFDAAKRGGYDAMVLDVMMPGMDGLAFVRALRAAGDDTPLLFLTARDAVEDRVAGLDAGANDYLTKPFAFEELTARIRALTRGRGMPADMICRVEDLTLDMRGRSVTRGGHEIALSHREFSVLEYLMRNAGVVLTRAQIEQYIWNCEYMGNSNIVDVYIRSLRRKVDDGFELKLIHTVRSVGYILKGRS